ncbi:MAG: hypothetical protein LAT53_07350 [Idiomarina sp.]|nr:hypothetical protein [Idiomarina sp.]
MKLIIMKSLILASLLATSPLAANASTEIEDLDFNHKDPIQVSIDVNGNYHLSFHTDELETSTASQETQEKEFYRSFLTSRRDGRFTTTEERVNGLISAIKYFTRESPRSFSLKPRGEKLNTEEFGEVQRYTFCVYFGPATKSTSCTHTTFSVNELDLISALDRAEIEYEAHYKVTDSSNSSFGFFLSKV